MPRQIQKIIQTHQQYTRAQTQKKSYKPKNQTQKNHKTILYKTNSIHIVNTIFFPPSICILDCENSKNIIFSLGGHGNWSTRSVISGQIDQNAPNQL